jgi:hypothetical protein
MITSLVKTTRQLAPTTLPRTVVAELTLEHFVAGPLRSFAERPDAMAVLRQAFGGQIDSARALSRLSEWRDGEFEALPTLRLVPDGVLNDAVAAYGKRTNTAFLAGGWATHPSRQPEDVVRVLLEEVGHALDAELNTHETPGDEGALFAALVLGDVLDHAQIAAFRAEDDWAWIVVDGVAEHVECAEFTAERIGELRDGFASSLTAIEAAIAQKALNGPVPLVGSGLMQSYQAGVADLRGLQPYKTAIYQALGQGGLLGPPNSNGTWTEVEIANAINTALRGQFPGNPTLSNNPVSYDTNTNEFIFSDQLFFSPYTQSLNSSTQSLNSSSGLDDLLVRTGGFAQLGVSYQINLAMGFDTEFYLRTNRANGPEIQLDVTLLAAQNDPTRPPSTDFNPNLSVGGEIQLGGQQVFQAIVRPGTQFDAFFDLDLVDPNADGRLRLGELNNNYGFLNATLSGRLNLDIALDTPERLEGLVKVHTDLGVDWTFTRSAAGYGGTPPTITLKNTQVDFLSFINDVLRPFLDKVQLIMEPIGLVLDVLKADIKPLHYIPGGGALFLDIVDENNGFAAGQDGKITLLDLAKLRAPGEFESVRKFIAVVNNIESWYSFLATPFTFTDKISVGDFRISSVLTDGSFSFDAANALVTEAAQDLEQFVQSQIGGLNGGSTAATMMNILAATRAGPNPIGQAAVGSVAAPLLAGGQSALGYLFGQNIDLIKFDLPRLDFSFGGEVDRDGRLIGDLAEIVQIPIFFPGLFLEVEGGLRASIDVDFGYDTRGLQHYLTSGPLNGQLDSNKLLDGIYVTDWDANGQERPEVIIGGQLNFGLSAGTTGSSERSRAGLSKASSSSTSSMPAPGWMLPMTAKFITTSSRRRSPSR